MTKCDYKSSRADNLRTHLQKHSGEKLNKCNQCEFDLGNSFEDTFENTQQRKVTQLQSVPLQIFSCRQFENTFAKHSGEKPN